MGIAPFARLGNSPPQLAVLESVSRFELFNACKFQVDIHDSERESVKRDCDTLHWSDLYSTFF